MILTVVSFNLNSVFQMHTFMYFIFFFYLSGTVLIILLQKHALYLQDGILLTYFLFFCLFFRSKGTSI